MNSKTGFGTFPNCRDSHPYEKYKGVNVKVDSGGLSAIGQIYSYDPLTGVIEMSPFVLLTRKNPKISGGIQTFVTNSLVLITPIDMSLEDYLSGVISYEPNLDNHPK